MSRYTRALPTASRERKTTFTRLSAPDPVTGKRLHAHRRPLRIRQRRQGRGARPRHSGRGRQRRRLPADQRELPSGSAREPLSRAGAPSRRQREWPALEMHDVFKIYRSGAGRDRRPARGRPRASSGRDGRDPRPVRLRQEHAACPGGGPRSGLGRRRAQLRCARSVASSEAELAELPGAARSAIVFQSDNLWPTLTAQRERRGRRFASAGVESPRRSAPKRRSPSSGSAGAGRHRATALSGGEQQRVAIAAAVGRRAPLMLADEPTGELDADNQQVVLSALRRLRDRTRLRRRRRHPLRTSSPAPPTASIELRDGRGGPVSVATASADGALRLPGRVGQPRPGRGPGLTALPRCRPRDRGGRHRGPVGRSGSAKTTLLHRPGRAPVCPEHGVPCGGTGPSTLLAERRRPRAGPAAQGIAFVFQGANLLPHFTAYENVAFARQVAMCPRGELCAKELLTLVGLAAKVDHLPGELSGRRGPAGGHRPRPRPGPRAAPLRRADRTARLGHRPSRFLDLIDSPPGGVRLRAGRGHPRRRRRRP